MSRSAPVDNVAVILQGADFVVSDCITIRPKSSDLTVRRGEDLLLLKILGNIDVFGGVTGSEMRRLGSYLDATPLVVGLRAQDEGLKPGVVYFHHGVPVLNPDTTTNLFVGEVPPLTYATPGGLYVSLDGDVLAEGRQECGWNLGQLATKLGVSQHTVSKYENGMNVSIEVAIHLEELSDRPFSNPVDALTGMEDVRDAEPTPDDPSVGPDDEHVLSALTRAGSTAHPTVRAPFKAVSEDAGRKKETSVFTGHLPFTRSAKKCVQITSSLGETTRTCSIYFVGEQQKRESVDDTSIVSCEGFAAIDNPNEIRDLIRERTRDLAGS